MATKNSIDDKDVAKLRKRVDEVFNATRKVREQMLRHRRLFEGFLWDISEPEFDTWDKSMIQMNILFSTVQAIAPLMTDNRPITQVRPRFPFMQKIGEALNNVTKYWWDTEEIQGKIYEWVIDAMTCPYGVAKVWYDPNRRHGRCRYRFEVEDPIDFFIAPGYTDVWEAPYCGIRSMKPFSWVRENFPDVKEIKAAKSETVYDQNRRGFKFLDADDTELESQFVEVTEEWIRDDNTLEDETDEHGKTVKDEKGKKKKNLKYPYGKLVFYSPVQTFGCLPSPDNHGRPPWIILKNYTRPHDFTGISEIEMIEGLHKDLNLILKRASDWIRKYMNQNELADTTSGFDVDNYKANRTKNGQVFTWNSRGGTMKPPVMPISDPQMSDFSQQFAAYIVQMVQEVSGVTDISKGNIGKTERQSAVEAGILYETSNTRTRQKLRNLESSLARVDYLFLRCVMQYQTEPEYFDYQESDGSGYQRYGNSFAQADEMMRPKENPKLGALAQRFKDTGIPVTNPEDQKQIEEHARDLEDYTKFLEKFEKKGGQLDPLFFDFSVVVDSDSMLPMDKQSRANILLRLLQMAPKNAAPKMYELVLDHFQVKNAQDVIAAMNEAIESEAGGRMEQMKQQMSPEDMQAAQQKPGQFQQYIREAAGE